MNRNELVSVVITTYARPFTLRRAIESVLSQTYKNIELIVVDDNKNMDIRDEVKRIIASYNEPCIKLICNSKNMGGALSRNEGIKTASGEYIAFLDDDDEYLPEKINKQYMLMNEISNEKLALVYCYCEMINNKGKVERVYRYNYKGNCVYDGMFDCIAATSQWFCRKSALIDVGCFSDVPCKQDSNLIVKLLINGYSVDYVPEVLSRYYRDAGAGISTSGHDKRIEGEEALRKICRNNYELLTETEIHDIEYSFSCRLAEHYLACKKWKDFKECVYKILLIHPFGKKSLGTYKRIIIVILNR